MKASAINHESEPADHVDGHDGDHDKADGIDEIMECSRTIVTRSKCPEKNLRICADA